MRAGEDTIRAGEDRSSRQEVFCKKGVLKNFVKLTGKHLCQGLFFNKETLTQVFFCEFWEIFKKSFFYRTPLVAAFVKTQLEQVRFFNVTLFFN